MKAVENNHESTPTLHGLLKRLVRSRAPTLLYILYVTARFCVHACMYTVEFPKWKILGESTNGDFL